MQFRFLNLIRNSIIIVILLFDLFNNSILSKSFVCRSNIDPSNCKFTRKYKKRSKNIYFAEKKIKWESLKEEDLNNNIEWHKYERKYDNDNWLLDAQKELEKPNFNKYDYFDLNYQSNFRIDPIINTSHIIPIDSNFFEVVWKSSFSGGQAGGTGNQDYGLIYDYGLSEKELISFYYSVSDDPLYSKIIGQEKPVPNYWQNFAISYKKNIFNNPKSSLSVGGSFELFDITSGSLLVDNIFNNNREFSTQKFIGSLFIPFQYELNDKLSLYIDNGVVYFPSKISDLNFFDTILYSGTGIDLKINNSLKFISSIKIPFTGHNSFDESLEFHRFPIYSIGFDYELDEKVDFKIRTTNSFMISPSTSILTIPSNNIPLYYLGLSLKPYNFDRVHPQYSRQETKLSFGGLSVGNALLNPNGIYSLNFLLDSKGSYNFKLKNAFSNKLELEFVNISSTKNSPQNNSQPDEVFNNFISEDNLNTRLGLVANFLRIDSSNFKYWNSGRISLGRSQKNKQGYYFLEQMNSFLLNENLTFNVNPKAYLTNLNSIFGLGLSINYSYNDFVDLIAETNIYENKNIYTNNTFGLRFFLNNYQSLDLYYSNAVGLFDISSMLNSNESNIGLKINIRI